MTLEELKDTIRGSHQGVQSVSCTSRPYGSPTCDPGVFQRHAAEIVSRLTARGRLSGILRADKSAVETRMLEQYHAYFRTRQGSKRVMPREVKSTLARIYEEGYLVVITFKDQSTKEYLVRKP